MAVRLPPGLQSPGNIVPVYYPGRSKLSNSAREGSPLHGDLRGAGRRTVAFHSPPECLAPRCLLQAVAVTIMTKESRPQPPQTGPAADTDQAAGGLGTRGHYATALDMLHGRKSQGAEALEIAAAGHYASSMNALMSVFTPEQHAALNNCLADDGSPLEAAKVLRDRPEIVKRGLYRIPSLFA
jgi:hypothetical protein